jgi:hypothetical protein
MGYILKKTSLSKLDEYINNYNDFFNDYLKYLQTVSPYFKINSINNIVDYFKDKITYHKKIDNESVINFYLLFDKTNLQLVGIYVGIKMNHEYIKLKVNDFTIKDKLIYTKNLFISPQYRGKGLCKKLIKKIVRDAKKNNINHIVCDILNTNIASIKCHTEMKFKPIKNKKNKGILFYLRTLFFKEA